MSGAGLGGSMEGGGKGTSDGNSLKELIIDDLVVMKELELLCKRNGDARVAKLVKENKKLKEVIFQLQRNVEEVTLKNGELGRMLEKVEDVCRMKARKVVGLQSILDEHASVMSGLLKRRAEWTTQEGPVDHSPAATAHEAVPASTWSGLVPATTGSEVQSTIGTVFLPTIGEEVWATIGSEVSVTTENEVPVTTLNEEPLVTIKTEFPDPDSVDNPGQQNLTALPALTVSNTNAPYDGENESNENEDAPVLRLETVKEEELPPQSPSKIKFLTCLELVMKRGKRNCSKIRPNRGSLGLRPAPLRRMRVNSQNSSQFQPIYRVASNGGSKRPHKRRIIARRAQNDDVRLHHRVDEAKATYGYYCCCGKELKTRISLHRHIRYFNEDWKFRCVDCKEIFFCSTDLRRHMYKAHGKSLSGVAGCSKCGKMFESRKDSWKHRKECGSK